MLTTHTDVTPDRHKRSPASTGLKIKDRSWRDPLPNTIGSPTGTQPRNKKNVAASGNATRAGTPGALTVAVKFQWIRAALRLAIPRAVKDVYLYLLTCADKDGICYPCIGAIAEGCDMGRRSVDLCLEALAAMGLVLRGIRAGPLRADKRNHTDRFKVYAPAIANLDALDALKQNRQLKRERQEGTPEPPLESAKGRNRVARLESIKGRNETGLRGATKPGLRGATALRTEQTVKSTATDRGDRPAAPAAAGSREEEKPKAEKPISDVEAMRDVLIQAGIGEPTRTELSHHPAATVEILKAAVAVDGGIGLKILKARDALSQAKAGQHVEANRRASQTSERKEHAASVCRDFREVYFTGAVARLHLEAMEVPERDKIWQAYLAEANGTGGTLKRMGWRDLAGDVILRMLPDDPLTIRARGWTKAKVTA